MKIKIKGMSCQHCVQTIKKALEEIDGITNVAVDLATGEVTFEETRPVDGDLMREKIKKAGLEGESKARISPIRSRYSASSKNLSVPR